MKIILSLVLAVALLSACHNAPKKAQSDGSSAGNVALSGAGSTFAMPIYTNLFGIYQKQSGVSVTYGGIGSGGGIRSLTDKVVDFGASDAFLSDEQMSKMPAPVVHIPTCLGAVVVAYNLPGVDGIKLTSDQLADIFLGKITKWNDPKLKANNPDLKFPALDITVVHRSDGSGTTAIFANYLTKVNKEWAEKVGEGTSLNWPVGLGGKGNPGVAGTISSTKGAIGYVGSEYAFAQNIQMCELMNSSGNYIKPTIESASAAAKGDFPADGRVWLTNSSDPEAYPICGLTWIIIYKDQNYNGRSLDRATAMLKLFDWMLTPEAQSQMPKINYVPLSNAAVEKTKAILRTVTYDGKPIL